MKLQHVAAPLAVGLLAATAAAADPRLDEKVYTPYIQNGVAELEVHGAREVGGPSDGDAKTVIEGEYGLNDRFSLAVVGAVEHTNDGTTRLASVGLEGVAYVGQIPLIGVDTGAYLEYVHGMGADADVVEGKLLFAKVSGRFQGLFNLILERPLSPRDEAFGSYGYAASATWRTVGALRIGAEAFGDLGSDHDFPGRSAAYVGPQLLWEGTPRGSPVEIDIDAGWLFAAGEDTREANSQVRIGVEFEHRF